MRLVVLAAFLLGAAGLLTGIAAARPAPTLIANAALFWVWAAIVLRMRTRVSAGRMCLACGAADPMQLPDGSCARCAAPAKKAGFPT